MSKTRQSRPKTNTKEETKEQEPSSSRKPTWICHTNKSTNPYILLKNTLKLVRSCHLIYRSKVNISNTIDFEVLGFLGKGAFGKVYLVRRLLTNDKYAMKVIKIYEGLDSRKIENIAN